MICVAHGCDSLDAATEFEVYPPEPAAEILCFEHYRELVRKRQSAALTRRRVEILNLPAMTCYGDGGTCTNSGNPYPGGPYCEEHAPDAFTPTEQELPQLHATFVLEHEPPAEPLLPAMPCPADRMPGSVRSAVKYAQANAWEHDASIAIGPEPEQIHSVTFWASKDDVILSSRHEGTDAEHLGFKIAWHQIGGGLPIKIGWRELVAALQGTDPIEVEKQKMRDAVLTVMDVGGTVIEINETG